MAFRRRTVVQLDDVCAVRAGPRPCPQGAHTGSDDHAVALEGRSHRLGVPGVVRRREAWAGLHDRCRHPEPDVHLGQLAAGRAAAQHQQAGRQLTGEGRLAVRPRLDVCKSFDRWLARGGAHGDHDVPGGQLVGRSVVGDVQPALADDARRTAVRDGAGGSQGPDVSGVVRLLGIGRPVDHEVALG